MNIIVINENFLSNLRTMQKLELEYILATCSKHAFCSGDLVNSVAIIKI